MRISDWSSDVCSSDLDQKTSFKKPTWRVALEHDFADDVLGYLSYNRGFKSGVYNILSLTGAPVRPEIVDAYEAGLKTTFLDRKVRLNVAAFGYGFQDIQLGSFALAGSISLRNAARRSEERRVGKECVSTCRSRWSPCP